MCSIYLQLIASAVCLIFRWIVFFCLTGSLAAATFPGDVDEDGQLSLRDLGSMESELYHNDNFSEFQLSRLDINSNGVADNEDLQFLRSYLSFSDRKSMAAPVDFLNVVIGKSTASPSDVDAIIKKCMAEVDGESRTDLRKFLIRYIEDGGGLKQVNEITTGFPPRDLCLILSSIILENESVTECSKYDAKEDSKPIQLIRNDIQIIRDVLEDGQSREKTRQFARTYLDNATRVIQTLAENNRNASFASTGKNLISDDNGDSLIATENDKGPRLVTERAETERVETEKVETEGITKDQADKTTGSDNKSSAIFWVAVLFVPLLGLAAFVFYSGRKPVHTEVAALQRGEQPLNKANRYLKNRNYDRAIAEFQKILESPYLENKNVVKLSLAMAFAGKQKYSVVATHIAGIDYSKIPYDLAYKLGVLLEAEKQCDLALSIYRNIYANKTGFKDVESRIESLQENQVSLGMFDVEALERQFAPRYGSFSVIGKGGMGAVFKVRDRQEQTTLALKIILPEISGKENFKQRFTREIGALKSVSHPNIIKVFDTGIKPVYHFFMEYVEGTPLSRFIETNKLKKNYKFIIAIAREIAVTLAFVHSKRILHRDIKPDNILVTDKGNIKLLDFGVARVEDLTLLTVTGEFVGTMSYAGPEMLESGNADNSSDVFSFGVMLYEMICGEKPWNNSQLLLGVRRPVPEPLCKQESSCPSKLSELVSDCIKLRQNERIKSFDEVLKRLDNL
jgi:tetratricopeptide (TPR) repeat protein